MNKREWNDGLNQIDSDLVEEYLEQKEKLANKKLSKRRLFRFAAFAACFALIIGAVIAVLLTREGEPDIDPYIPSGDIWSPTVNPNIDAVVLTADEVAKAFDELRDSKGTNQYTKVYSTDIGYLGITPLPNAEYLPIYSADNSNPSESELNDFVEEYISVATAFFGVPKTNYNIEKNEYFDGSFYCFADVGEESLSYWNYIRFVADENYLYFNRFAYPEKRMTLNGSRITLLESDSDVQIKDKLKEEIAYICDSFGKEYSEIKIVRNYTYDQLESFVIYLYSPEETIFPSDFHNLPMASEYISLTFYTDWGSGTMCDWGGSKEEAFLTYVSVYKASEKWNKYYSVDKKARMLSLEEAEALLEKGYVFGGHSCQLCMAEQPEVDFGDYTCVEIEYVSDKNNEICIPFYAFYKYIGETSYGMGTYAKTYVPAVEVSGLEEYFRIQTENHRNIDYEVVG